MQYRFVAKLAAMCASLFAAQAALAFLPPLNNDFTYQGQLKQSGSPANGNFDFECSLFDAASGGVQIGSAQIVSNVPVADGLFTMSVNFGASAFNGDDRFLQIGVRPTSGGAFTTLSPRQKLNAAPFASYALQAGLSGAYGNTVSFTNPANSFFGNGANITGLNASNIASGNLNAGRLPTGGSWLPTSSVNVDANTFVIDPLNNRVGIGTATPTATLDMAVASANPALQSINGGSGAAGLFSGPDNNGTTAALRVESGSQVMLVDGNEIDGLDPIGLFLNNNVVHDVLLATGGGHVGIRTSSPSASLSVGNPGVLHIFVPGDSTCFTPQTLPGCSDPGCQALVCAVDAFCCNNAWDSVCVGEANDLCVGRVGIGTGTVEAKLQVAGGTDTAATGGGFLVLGSTTGANVSIDNNEIMARNNGAAAALALNADGGNVNILQNGGGNVGIGTNAQSAILHVTGSAAANRGAVYGVQTAGFTSGGGVFGLSTVANANGVIGEASSGGTAYGVWGKSTTGEAGHFSGDVDVVGALSKNSGSFKIDHPLDPANKYLYHAFVESPDMMNVYNGNIITGWDGYATIFLPDWFETLNRDFRYQLTVLDEADSEDFVMVKVVSKIANNQFTIRSSKPDVEVSWQVTGIRQDRWAEAHRIPVEVDKPAHERGFYRNPELWGLPQSLRVEEATRPGSMKDLPAKEPTSDKKNPAIPFGD